MTLLLYIYVSVAVFVILTMVYGFSEFETILLMTLSGILVGCLI